MSKSQPRPWPAIATDVVKPLYPITMYPSSMHDRGVLHKRIMRWGDRYCIILSEQELQEHALHAGDEVDFELTPCNSDVDWEALPYRVLVAGKNGDSAP